MAAGGIVQRFSEGSDEDAVTPVGEEASSVRDPFGSLTPEQLKTVSFLMRQNQPGSRDLRAAMEARTPLYRDLLGADSKEMAQGQSLLDLTQGFLNLASNVGPDGRPLRGSGASRFAGAFRGVPGQLATRAGDMAKQEQAVKLAALQSAEKSVDSDRAMQLRLAIAQAGAEGKAGKITGTAFNQIQERINGFVARTNTEAQNRQLMNAMTEYLTPKITTITNKLGGLETRVTRANMPQSFADGYVLNYGQEALDEYLRLNPEVKISSLGLVSPDQPPQDRPPQDRPPSSSTPGIRQDVSAAPSTDVEAFNKLVTGGSGLWRNREFVVGVLNTAEAAISRLFPGQAPNIVDSIRKEASKRNESLIRVLSTNDGRVNQDEMVVLRNLIGLTPGVFGSEGSMSTVLVSIDDELIKQQEILEKVIKNPDQYLGRDIADARMKLNAIDVYRKSLEVPGSIFTEAEFKALPVYTEYVDKRDPKDFKIARKNTFSYRDEPSIRSFQKNNPGAQYAIILPSKKVQLYTVPKKPQ
jgi:hypothetical protein